MKKVIFAVLISFAFMASSFVQSVSAQKSTTFTNHYANCPFSVSVYHGAEFMKIYHKVLELNAGRFSDLNKIQIGDTVLFPSLTVVGTNEFLIADTPINGVHDCLYRMTDKYICGQLKTTPLPVAKKVAPAPVKAQDVLFWTSDVFWKSLIGIMILMTLIYLVLYYGYIKDHDVNSNPVLPGGLSDDASRAKQQIEGITAGLQIVKVERGRVFGNIPAKVIMNFSNKPQEKYLISGEDTYRVTEFNGSFSYYRQHCGNRMNPIADGQFDLPDGWVFVPYTNEQSTWSAPKVEETKPETEAIKPEIKNDELFKDSVLNGTDIAMILDAAGKMGNFPSSISVGDLTVRFYKNNEKAE